MPHVLVIEDDPSTQTLFAAVLRLYGMESRIVSDGESALDAMRRTRFDAVVLDLMLPKVNGFEILRELKCTGRGILSRVVVCSAASESMLRDCEELRLVHKFLPKPVDLRLFAQEVLRAAGQTIADNAEPAMINLITVELQRDAS
ncbi:MAG TPA: response regulator [Thermoanaerobaculia bacterium]|jgi:CheY-like chemotaxis protein